MDPVLTLALIILMIAFTVIGIRTQFKIYSILAAGVAAALIIEYQTNAAMVLTFAAVIIFQGYYALFGGRM